MDAGHHHPRYFNDTDLGPRLRRLAIAFVLGLLIAGALSGITQLLALFFPQISEVIATVVEFLKLPKAVGKLPWNWGVILFIAIPLAGVFLKPVPLARRLDFLLFAPFAHDVLNPIGAATGIFKWYLPESGPVRDTWNRLRQWVTHEAGDGRWQLRWLMAEPHLKEPFAWTLLVGVGGIGKTQLAKELGRHLAARDVFGDKAATETGLASGKRYAKALAAWWRRIVPRIAVADSDPWDAALIGKRTDVSKAEPIAMLKEWSPRRPTLLILDDPDTGTCNDVIEALEEHKRDYWYPVRLLIVHTVVPADLPVEPDAAGVGWHFREKGDQAFVPFVLPEQTFDETMVRAVLAGGYWVEEKGRCVLRPGATLRALFATDNIRALIGAVEGSPLLIASAVLWLDADASRSVAALVNTTHLDQAEMALFEERKNLKALVEHRLIRERVQEYYDRYKSIDDMNLSTALRQSVACATVAHGLALAKAREYYALKLEQTALRRVFPFGELGAKGAIEAIPPLRPWPLGESLVRDVWAGVLDSRPEALHQMIEHAVNANPRGTLKALARKGWLAGEVARAIDTLPPPADNPGKLAMFEAYAHHCLYADRSLLPQALRRAGELAPESVFDALRRLDRLTAAAQRGYGATPPNSTTHFTLYCHLAARLMRQEPENHALRHTALRRIEALMLSLPDLRHLPAEQQQTVSGPFAEAVETMLRNIDSSIQIAQRFEALKAVYDHVVRRLGDWHLPLLVPLAARLGAADRVYSEVTACCAGYWCLWHALYAGNIDAVRATLSVLDSRAKPRQLSTPQATLVRLWGKNVLTLAYALNADRRCDTENVAREVDNIAAPFAGDAQFEIERAQAWGCVAYARSQLAEQRALSEAAAREVDKVAAPFAGDAQFERERAVAWRFVAYARSQLTEQRALSEAAAREVDNIAAPFAGDAQFEIERAQAWGHVAYARGQLAEQRALSEAAAREVDKIAAPFAGDAQFEIERAVAWLYVALAARDMGRAQEAVQHLRFCLDVASRFSRSEEAERFEKVVRFARAQLLELGIDPDSLEL